MSYGYPPGGHGPPGAPPPGGAYPPPPAGYPQAPPYGQAPYGQAPYGQAPYGQAPYGQPPQQPYAPPQAPFGPGIYGQPMAAGQMRQQHPRAMTALILGGVAWFFGLWLICSVPAWIIGASALKEIRANPQMYTGETEAKLGMWLGIVHTALGALVIFGLIILGIVVAVAGG